MSWNMGFTHVGDAIMTATMAGLAPIDVSNPDLYQTDTWQEAFARLRAEDPVQYVPESSFGPYWSVVRYKDIMTV